MAGHPSVKKRQKEAARKERQVEKASKRDERRVQRTTGEGEKESDILEFGQFDEFGVALPPGEFRESPDGVGRPRDPDLVSVQQPKADPASAAPAAGVAAKP